MLMHLKAVFSFFCGLILFDFSMMAFSISACSFFFFVGFPLHGSEFDYFTVRRVKMRLDTTTGCSFSSVKPTSVNLQALRSRLSNLQSTFSAGWEAMGKVRFLPHISANASFSRNSLAYVQASTQYIKQVSSLLKVGVTTLRSSSTYDLVQGN